MRGELTQEITDAINAGYAWEVHGNAELTDGTLFDLTADKILVENNSIDAGSTQRDFPCGLALCQTADIYLLNGEGDFNLPSPYTPLSLTFTAPTYSSLCLVGYVSRKVYSQLVNYAKHADNILRSRLRYVNNTQLDKTYTQLCTMSYSNAVVTMTYSGRTSLEVHSDGSCYMGNVPSDQRWTKGDSVTISVEITMNSTPTWRNARVRLYLSIGDDGEGGYAGGVNLGAFYVTSAKFTDDVLRLSLADLMTLADYTPTVAELNSAFIGTSYTMEDVFLAACEIAGLQGYTGADGHIPYLDHTNPLGSTVKARILSEHLTCRQMMEYACASVGGLCKIVYGSQESGDNVVIVIIPSKTGGLTLTEYQDLELSQSAINVTGYQAPYSSTQTIEGESVKVTNYSLAGSASGYVISLPRNPLYADTQANATRYANSVYTVLGSRSFTPFDLAIRANPFIEPFDHINFVDRNGNTHDSFVMDVQFQFAGQTKIKNTIETEE